MNFKLGIVVFVALLLLLFTAQNYRVVEVRFLLWQVEMSRAVMILGVFLGGFVVGSLISRRRRIRSE